jgi:hypothetical protein
VKTFGLVNQVPMPPMTMIRRLAAKNLPRPRSPARKPSTSSGSELAIRCPKPACMKGAVKMPISPAGCPPTMANSASRSPGVT